MPNAALSLLNFSSGSSQKSKLSAVLYDDVYGYLYVLLRENSSKTVCYVFHPKFGNKAILEEDFQYNQMFYYHARKDGELPIHLCTGHSRSKSSKAELMQVTGNLVYLSVSSEPGFSLFKSSVRERCTNLMGNCRRILISYLAFWEGILQSAI
uniref:Uncharacterized protein n=1 Tax=Ditylenchus dipsaci TaxID=166011 RepID=A0A915CMX2_9BILA